MAAFNAALLVLFWREIPKSNEQLLTYMLGQLSGFASSVILFHFGTSKGSEDETEILARAKPLDAPSGTPDDPVYTDEVKP